MTEYARRPTGTAAAPPVSQALIRAQELLTDLGRDGSARGEALWALLNQAERIRLEITALSGLREHLSVGAHEAVAVLIDQALLSAAIALAAIADGMSSDRAPAPAADARLPLEREADALRAAAAGRDAVSRDAIATREAIGRLEALAGQLRSAVALGTVGSTEGAEREARAEAAKPVPLQVRAPGAILLANLTLTSTACRHALRMAGALAAADILTRATQLPRAYWVPMTVAFVLQPDYGGTYARLLARLAGTALGLVVTTALIHLAGDVASRILIAGLLVFILRAFGPANYGMSAAVVTGTVIVLVSFAGTPPGPTMLERGVNTLLGGMLVLAAYAVWPTWEESQTRLALADMLDAYRSYIAVIMAGYAGPARPTQGVLADARLQARLARSNAEASIDRLMKEPVRGTANRSLLLALLASSHRLVHSAIALEAHLPNVSRPFEMPELRLFVESVDTALRRLAEAVRGETRPARSFPDLRTAYGRAAEAASGNGGEDLRFLMLEADSITNTVNTLAYLLLRPPETSA